eukprot:scaffold369286_cov17-Prasinocladus_malaysianus.AAC.1
MALMSAGENNDPSDSSREASALSTNQTVSDLNEILYRDRGSHDGENGDDSKNETLMSACPNV